VLRHGSPPESCELAVLDGAPILGRPVRGRATLHVRCGVAQM